MKLHWQSKARSDLLRLHQFLVASDRRAAKRIIRSLAEAPKRLLLHPRIGEQVDEFDGIEVRRLLVGDYELRYEILDETIFVLRIWHTREDR